MAAPKPLPVPVWPPVGTVGVPSDAIPADPNPNKNVPTQHDNTGTIAGLVGNQLVDHLPVIGPLINAIGGPVQGVKNTVSTAEAIAAFIANPVRVVEAITGLALIIVGVNAALKGAGTPAAKSITSGVTYSTKTASSVYQNSDAGIAKAAARKAKRKAALKMAEKAALA